MYVYIDQILKISWALLYRFSASVDNAVIVELQATIGGSSKTVSSGHQKAVGWTKIGQYPPVQPSAERPVSTVYILYCRLL